MNKLVTFRWVVEPDAEFQRLAEELSDLRAACEALIEAIEHPETVRDWDEFLDELEDGIDNPDTTDREDES